MLTLPALFVIVFTKRAWLRATAWCVWVLGLIHSLAKGNVLLYVMTAAFWLGILYLIRWIVRRAKSNRVTKAEANDVDSTLRNNGF